MTMRPQTLCRIFLLWTACNLPCFAGTFSIAYVANQGNNTIESFNSSGTGSTFATGLSGPQGLGLDTAGNVYVCYGNSVLKFTPAGVQSTFSNTALLNGPTWVTVDSSGNVFVSNYSSNNIIEITTGGSASVFASANISGPEETAFDSHGNLFVANRNNNSITKITPSGTSSTFASLSGLLIGLAIDSSDNVYVANRSTNQIIKYAPDGTSSTFATGLNAPKGLAFDSSDNLYAVNSGTPNIVVIAPSGTASVLTTSSLNTPDGIVLVSPPSLSISATHSTPIYQGGPASISLTVTKSGSATTGSVTVSDTIDSAFTINSYSSGCTNIGQTVTCTIASGSTVGSTTFTIYITASATASTAGISNTATLSDSYDTVTTSTANDTIPMGAELPNADSNFSQLVLSGSTDNGACSAGNRTLTATDQIRNMSGTTVNNPYAEIVTLSQGNTLISQSADVTTVASGANVTFTFNIQLASCAAFQLYFDVHGN